MSERLEVRSHILDFLKPRLDQAGMAPDQIADDSDLFAMGVLDSFDVVALFADVEETFGIEAELAGSEDEDFRLSIDWLCRAFERGVTAG